MAPTTVGGDCLSRRPGLLDLSVEHHENVTVVGLQGEVDLTTAPELAACLRRCTRDGVGDVVVDLGGLRFLGAQGLRALVDGRDRLRRRGGQLVLRSPSPFTAKLLRLTGLHDHLEDDPLPADRTDA